MKKSKQFILLFLGLVISSSAICQLDSSFTLLDLNGTKKTVRVKESWSEQSCKLTLLSPTSDSFKVAEIADVTLSKVLQKKYLLLEFRIRGGSGIHLRYTRVFSVKNGHICQVLSLLSTYKSEGFSAYDNESYSIEIEISKQNNRDRVRLKESGKNINQDHKSWNRVYYLSFDTVRMVFYNRKVDAGTIPICGTKTHSGQLYSVILYQDKYVILGNQWYMLGQKCYSKM